MRILAAFEPQLRVDTSRGRATLVDTTGDRRDAARSVLLPKATAAVGEDAQGQRFVAVPTTEGSEHWVPLDAFQQTAGDDGLLYLPTFQDSPLAAAVGGGVKGLLALGPLGAVAGVAAGSATKLAGDSWGKAAKLALGASAGAAVMAATNSVFFGPSGIPIALLLGAATGVASVQAGEGEAAVRDAAYGGTAAGVVAGMLTGAPLALLTGSVASGLGARSRSKVGQVALGAVAGAALQTGQAWLSGGSLPMALAIGAAVGAAGPLIGPPLMQATRNLSQAGGDVLRQGLRNAPDSLLIAAGSVPFAASGGLLGASLNAVAPGWGGVGAAVGALAGAGFGAYRTHGQIARAKQAAARS